jgi:hypothetical protein
MGLPELHIGDQIPEGKIVDVMPKGRFLGWPDDEDLGPDQKVVWGSEIAETNTRADSGMVYICSQEGEE